MDDPLTLRFASTIRARRTGLTDALDTPESMSQWLAANSLPIPGLTEETHRRVVALRQAVRALFAKAVSPAPPSSADANALPPFQEALALVNREASPVLRQLSWQGGWQEEAAPTAATEESRLTAALAEATIGFFASPDVKEVRACPAPRCVLYFVKKHPRQEWCSIACGNRARAARHYHQHRP
ncbi:ABATE domain-containing protein [Nonomuraea sp. NBC_01738]|uniref:CGNR zinc finger domain-containing protein n=1 Tax=Nonomuraea sp. NBC_01738 TaxID=2976003 RepID=UPI002E0E89D8|nr:ABATE domain-containing protein [Nonomuraea sp. NBC_01738]